MLSIIRQLSVEQADLLLPLLPHLRPPHHQYQLCLSVIVFAAVANLVIVSIATINCYCCCVIPSGS